MLGGLHRWFRLTARHPRLESAAARHADPLHCGTWEFCEDDASFEVPQDLCSQHTDLVISSGQCQASQTRGSPCLQPQSELPKVNEVAKD